MHAEIPQSNPEKKETLDDNARKFITAPIDPAFLAENHATSHHLVVDWLETGVDNEKKVAYKTFENNDVQILLIAKVTIDGNRTSQKQPITEEEYGGLLHSSTLHLEKKRYEFAYQQNNTVFSVKYDTFPNDKPPILEVDAATTEERDSFDPSAFPAHLHEVTGDIRYYGYHVAENA
jgi:hypothetical protein